MLARRHRREIDRISLERDALAARFAAERALSITEAQLHALFESSLAAIAIFHRDRRIVQANAGFRMLAPAYDRLQDLAAELAAGTFETLDRMTVVERRVETSGGPVWLSLSTAAGSTRRSASSRSR